MKRILIFLLLCPLTMMAMDLDPEAMLYLESRVHQLKLDTPTAKSPTTIIYHPRLKQIKYVKTDKCWKYHFPGHNDRAIQEISTYLYSDTVAATPPHLDPYYNMKERPFYRFLVSVQSITNNAIEYQCAVEKYQSDSVIADITQKYEASIPFPAQYNTATRCKLIFTDIEQPPTTIYPQSLAKEQLASTMAALNPKLWINIKAEYVPKNGSPKHITHKPAIIDIE